MTGGKDAGWRGWLDRVEGELEKGSPQLERVADAILDRARLTPGEKVVDLGAGTGFLSFRAADRLGPGGAVTAVDRDRECLAAIRGRAAGSRGAEIVAVHGRLESLPFDDGEFDAALCRSALIYSTDMRPAVSEMLRVAGRFSLFEPLPGETLWTGDPGGGFLELEAALRESGGPRAVDRSALRGALDEAGAGRYESLVAHLEPRMRGRNPAELAEEYLYDLPGDLAALNVLKESVPEERIIEAVNIFAEAAALGMVRCSVPCMFAWREKADG